MKKLKSLLLLVLAVTCLKAQSQFMKSFGVDHFDHNYYSIESDESNDLYIAGNIYNQGSTTAVDIHLQKVNDLGVIIWEQKFDFSDNERCLDIALDDESVIITGAVIENNKHRLLVARFDKSNGSLINSKVFDSRITGFEQFGLVIEVNPFTGNYFVGGRSYDSGGSKALIMSLDNGLNINWSKEVNQYSLVRSIEVISPDKIYINCQSNSNIILDNSGSVVWAQKEITSGGLLGHNAVEYDPASDMLFKLSNGKKDFVITQIDNVSTNPSITKVVRYEITGFPTPYTGMTSGAAMSVKLNRNEDEPNLVVLLNALQDSPSNNSHLHPVTVALDLSLDVLAANFLEVFNQNDLHNPTDYHYGHDSYLAWGQVYPPGLGELTPWEEGFGFITYNSSQEGVSNLEFEFSVVKTNNLGQSNLDCESDLEVSRINMDFSVEEEVSLDEYPQIGIDRIRTSDYVEHSIIDDCWLVYPCEVSDIDIAGTYTDCRERQLTVTYNTQPGSSLHYIHWDFGDGTINNTLTNTVTHDFINNNDCYPNVCVTVFIKGDDGVTICDETYCEVIDLTLNFGGCGPCCEIGGPCRLKFIEGDEENKVSNADVPEVNVYPIPANNRLNIDFGFFVENSVLKIVSMEGQMIKEKVSSKERKVILDLSNINSGIYYLETFDGINRTKRKIVIK